MNHFWLCLSDKVVKFSPPRSNSKAQYIDKMPFQHSGNWPETSTNWEVLMHEKLWSLRHSCQHLLLNHLLLPFILKVKVTQLCLTLYNCVDCSTPGFPVLYSLLELAQTHVHWVSDAIQPSHPLSSPSLSVFNLSQHQGHFQWVSSSHQVANVLELQL